MLPNAIPLAGVPITMPGAIPEATFKGGSDLPALLPFKDLLLGFQATGGMPLPASNIPVPDTTAALSAPKTAELSSLAASDDIALEPTLQSAQNEPDESTVPKVSSNSTQNDASLSDDELQTSSSSTSQSSVVEPQMDVASPVPKGLVVGKPDRKTGSSASAKGKSSSKRIETSTQSSGAVPVVPTEATTFKANNTTLDSNIQVSPVSPKPLINSAVVEGAVKLPQKIAASKSDVVKWPVVVEPSTPQKHELTDQLDKVAASVATISDDQGTFHDAIAIESNPKAIRTVSPRESPFIASPQPAAVFHASLTREANLNRSVTNSDNDSPLMPEETPALSTISAPVSHLDLQWKDGTLGNVSVRAEMREGVLHAVVNGSHVSSAVSPTELHQFLEDSRIPVHSIQVNGVATVKHVSEAGGFDASAGNGAQASPSYRDDSSRSARSHSLPNRGNEEDEEKPIAVSAVPTKNVLRPEASRLSIHI